MIVKQSTAKELPCLLYDVTDFITPETGLAYTAVTVYIQKEGGAQTTKTLASGDWTERGHGVYDISFTAAELDTLGVFKYQVTDAQATFLDYNGAVAVESATLSDIDTDIATVDTVVDSIQVDTTAIEVDTTSIETKLDTVDGVVDAILLDTTAIEIDTTSIESKVDTVDTVVDSIQVDTTAIETKIDTVDTVVDAIKARTDVINTASELITAHGSGDYTTYAHLGTGAYNITINVKDDSAVDVGNVKVEIHNASDDDSPAVIRSVTDSNGNTETFNLDSGSYYVRSTKIGYIFTSTAITVSMSGTKNVTGTALVYPAPSDPAVCRLYLYPITPDNLDITNLDITFKTKETLTKVGSEFVKNDAVLFSYDATTTPDSYYADVVQGITGHINSDDLGIDEEEITVPAVATKDLSDLIS